MTDDELKLCLKDISSMQEVTDKRIINFMKRKCRYYEPMKFGNKYYTMNFQYKVYPATLSDISKYTDRVLAE